MSKCVFVYQCHCLIVPIIVVSVLAGITGNNAHAADASATLPTIVVTSPLDYQVFQREDRSKGTAIISGRLSIDAKARFRCWGKSITGDMPEQWNELPVTAGTHAFSLKVTVPAGGWYRLELQAYTGNIVRVQTQVAHVGMGEVFVVSGQSNSTNYGEDRLVPETGLVASFDGHAWGLAKDPQGGCDGSGGGSFIPAFGDALAKKYHVPIGVASTGQGATSVRQWLPQGLRVKQQPTTGGMKPVGPKEWESDGGLFNRLVQRFALLGPKGFRAVLWHQGESDAGQARAGYPADRQITGEQYFEFMGILIRAAQEKAGWPVPWFTAQTTYHVGDPSDAEFRAAMKKLWDQGVSLEGPDTDALREEYRSGVHFNGRGQREHGRLWAEKVEIYLDRELAKPTQQSHAQAQPIKFEPTLESLKQYAVPEWFEDAKVGIWAHWGPQGSTDIPYPIDSGWYARMMYEPGNPVYKWHLKNFGHPSVFGYKDILKRYNPSHFDAAQADKLVQKYKGAGAKFFVAMGVHHDNFDMWDSKYQPRWNAKAITGKDIVGLWHDAAIKNGLRFGVSSHVARSYRWFQTSHGADAGGKFDGQDPAYADLYGTPWKSADPGYEEMSNVGPAAWERQFEDRMKDLLHKYHPDLYYTDGGIPFKNAGLNILSDFYNQNQVWSGSLQAVATIKLDYQKNIAIQDYEFASSSALAKYPFMSDKTTNSHWWWLKGEAPHYRKANEVVDYLIDLVSKNGVLCLNIPLTPDGTLEPESETLLKEMGQCLDVIGEAIFGTRPWMISGEGPTVMTDFAAGTAKDIRFTRNKANNALYVTVLDWPGNGKTLTIGSLTSDRIDAHEIASIEMLGSSETLAWKQDAKGMHVVMPAKAPRSLYAFSLKIRLKGSLRMVIN